MKTVMVYKWDAEFLRKYAEANDLIDKEYEAITEAEAIEDIIRRFVKTLSTAEKKLYEGE